MVRKLTPSNLAVTQNFLFYQQVGATSISVLRSIWQSYWLHENGWGSDDIHVQLEQSLVELGNSFGDFTQQLSSAGWDLQNINLKVPKQHSFEVVCAA